MRSKGVRLLLVGGALVAAAGCATGEEWQIWRSNGAHFASGDHMFFSMRNNRDGSKPVGNAQGHHAGPRSGLVGQGHHRQPRSDP